MPSIPFIGRLHLQEYLALLGSFVLIGLEVIIRGITLALPGPIIRFFYNLSRKIFNSLSGAQGRRSRNRKKAISSPIAQASDFVELCELFGYYAEEHIVQTKDGYLLGLHRLGWKRGEEDQRVNSGEGSIQKKVVYLHHGLMMNSEVWVCLTEKERCLPFVLVDQGYDVWLGNNRGNKYSKKNVHHSPTSAAFWNYSIDQFAFHDIPDTIDYILATTSQKALSYVGFSQGTAQAFATLSIHPNLNEKVNVFVALAPAMAPPGLAMGIVSSFIKASPEVLFLLFGRKAILSSTTMWQALLYPGIFSWVIDKALLYLFGWHAKNITAYQKLAAYPHLFSFSSTKSVVHWLQIIRNETFQMFDDEVQAPLSIASGAKYYKVAKYPTRNIKTPIVLVYGGSDSLVDIKIMLKELPRHTVAKEIPHYEHLDFLWAEDVHKLVIPHVLEALESYSTDAGRKSIMSPFRPARPQSLLPASIPSYSEAESTTWDFANAESTRDSRRKLRAFRVSSPRRSSIKSRDLSGKTSPELFSAGSPDVSAITERSTNSRPEGWWSSDEVAGATSDPATPDTHNQAEKQEPETPDTHLPASKESERPDTRDEAENKQPETPDTSSQSGKHPAARRTSRLPVIQGGPGGGVGLSSPPPAVPSSVAAFKTSASSPSSHRSKPSIDSLRSAAGEASFGEHGISFGLGGKGLLAEGVVSKEIGAAQKLRALGNDGSASDSGKKRKAKQQIVRRE
ncbi:alpha/beta-hydrolase [Aureobasidium subglaciale]|nr:alpha/beta-hydrolase [Aureobasidium subglaciale]